MRTLCHHHRLPWFALAAIVGVLSMAGEASARSVKGVATAPKSCCVVATPANCCCCPAKADPVTSLAGESRLSSSDRSCECCPNDPAAPASKPESSSTEQRREPTSEQSIATAFAVRPSASFAPFIPPTGSPPKSPLHLLTTRLLI